MSRGECATLRGGGATLRGGGCDSDAMMRTGRGLMLANCRLNPGLGVGKGIGFFL